MAKKRGNNKSEAKRVFVKTDYASIEDETIVRVEKTLSTINDFLSKWDASAIKPEAMAQQVVRIKRFYDALSSWQVETSKLRGSGAGLKPGLRKDEVKGGRKGTVGSFYLGSRSGEQSRIKRLQEFVMICRAYF